MEIYQATDREIFTSLVLENCPFTGFCPVDPGYYIQYVCLLPDRSHFEFVNKIVNQQGIPLKNEDNVVSELEKMVPVSVQFQTSNQPC